MSTKWITWNELPWGARGPSATVVQLCDRLLRTAQHSESASEYLKSVLSEVSAELSAQWIGVWKRTSQWDLLAEHGRHAWPQPPIRFFDEVIEREANGCLPEVPDSGGWPVIGVPLPNAHDGKPRLLALAGRRLTADDLPVAAGVGRVLGYGLSLIDRVSRHASRCEKLRNTLAVAASFARVPDTTTLLEAIATAATRLLDCDRASIFIWDREQHDVVACPALGVEGGSLRIPDNVGIVGHVLRTGEAIRVDDAYADTRFSKAVDKATGYRTQTLLAVPLLDADHKRIGVFEGINKRQGSFDLDDEEALTQLGIQAAAALASTREREQLLRNHSQMTEQAASQVQIVGDSGAIQQVAIDRAAAGTDRPARLDPRREWNRQGGLCSGVALPWLASQASLHRGQLRGVDRDAAGKRTLRARKRSVHGCSHRSSGQI